MWNNKIPGVLSNIVTFSLVDPSLTIVVVVVVIVGPSVFGGGVFFVVVVLVVVTVVVVDEVVDVEGIVVVFTWITGGVGLVGSGKRSETTILNFKNLSFPSF